MLRTDRGLVDNLAAGDAPLHRPADREHAGCATHACDEMLTMVAHDLRNPRGVIEMASQLLLDAPGGEVEAMRKAVHMVQRAGRQMSRLVGDLLDARQIESGRFRVERRPELPSAVVRDALEMLDLIAVSKRQRLETEIEHGLPGVQVDAARIEQVISNLVGNASKFSPPDSVITVQGKGRERHGLGLGPATILI